MELNERFKLLSNYNVKNTLTENVVSILNEDAFTKALLKDTAIVAKDFEGVLQSMKADANIAKELETLKTGGVQTAEDLFAMIKLNKLSSEAKGFMNSAILKSGTKNTKMIELAAQDIVKSPAFAQKYFKSWVEGGGRPGLEKALKQSGKYSEDAITQIVIQTEKNLTTLEKMSKVKLKVNPKATEEIIAASGKSEKQVKELIKQDSFFAKKKKYFTDLYNRLKSRGISKETLQRWKQRGFLNKNGKISWKKVALWAVAIGISYNVLKDMLNKGGVFIDDTDTGGGNGNGNGGNGNGNGGGNTGGSTFKECADFPYKKGCSSSVVSEVQKCLGIGADGKFGSKTEKALTDGGYGTEITQDVYNKIKEKCGTGGTGGTTITTTLPAPVFQDLDVDADSITI